MKKKFILMLLFFALIVGFTPQSSILAQTNITQGEQFEQGKYDLQAEFPFGQNWNNNSSYAGTEINKVKWEYKIFRKINTSADSIQLFYGQPVIGRNGTIYIGNHNHKLYAFNKDGSIKWTKEDITNMESSPVIAEDGTIYVAGGVIRNGSGRLTALNSDGSIKWQITKGIDIRDTPIIDKDGTIYVRNNIGNRLEAYNSDGSKKWQSDSILPASYASNSMRISKDGTIYTLITRQSGSAIYAHDKNGKELWKKILKGKDFGFTLGLNGELFINGDLGSNTNDMITVLDKDGNLIKEWSQVPKSIYGTQSTPTVYSKDGTIYISGIDGLYAYNPDYTLKWKYSSKGIYEAPVIDKNGVIYFKSNAELNAVNPDGTLKLKLSHSFHAVQANNSITIDKDGNLYTVGIGTEEKDTYYSLIAIGDDYVDKVCTKESTFREVLQSLKAKSKNAKLTEEEKKEVRDFLEELSTDPDKKDN